MKFPSVTTAQADGGDTDADHFTDLFHPGYTTATYALNFILSFLDRFSLTIYFHSFSLITALFHLIFFSFFKDSCSLFPTLTFIPCPPHKHTLFTLPGLLSIF